MMGKGLFRVVLAIMVSALSVLPGCLSGENTNDDPDLGSLVENVALAPPSLLTVSASSPTTETITWSAINDDNLKYYIVDRGTTPDNVSTLTSVTGRTTWTSSNLTPGTQYCWGLRDVTNANEVSPRSNILCTSTPRNATTAAPANLTATAISDTRITVSWNSVSGATSYKIFRALGPSTNHGPFAGVASVSAPTTTVVQAGLTATTTYTYEVTAVGPGGESVPSNLADATTFTAGLEGWWKFDQVNGAAAMDSSGFKRDVTLTGAGFSSDRPPVRRLPAHDEDKNLLSLSISAAPGSQANAANQPAFRFAGASFSLSGWVKLTSAVATEDRKSVV